MYPDFFDVGDILQTKCDLYYDRKQGHWAAAVPTDGLRTMIIKAGEQLVVESMSEDTMTVLTDHLGEIELVWPQGENELEPWTGKISAVQGEVPPTLVRTKGKPPENWKNRPKIIKR